MVCFRNTLALLLKKQYNISKARGHYNRINFKKMVRDAQSETTWGLGAWCEMLPVKENRVTIDPNKKDAWGIPVSSSAKAEVSKLETWMPKGM